MGEPTINPQSRSYQLSDQFKAKLADKASDHVLDKADVAALKQGATDSEKQFIQEILTDKSDLRFETRKSASDPNSVNFDITARIELGETPGAPAAAASQEPKEFIRDEFLKQVDQLGADGLLNKSDFEQLAKTANSAEKKLLEEYRPLSGISHEGNGQKHAYLVTADFDVSPAFLKQITSLAKDGKLDKADIDKLMQAAGNEDEKAYLQNMVKYDAYQGVAFLNDAGQPETLARVDIEHQAQAAPAQAVPAQTQTPGEGIRAEFFAQVDRLGADGVLNKDDFAQLRKQASAAENQLLDDYTRYSAVGSHQGDVDPMTHGYLIADDLNVSPEFLKNITARARDGRLDKGDIEQLLKEAGSEDDKAYLQNLIKPWAHVNASFVSKSGELERLARVEIDHSP
ncbi:MAG: hypothetical protein ACAI44_00350 [Candidatus Sericytochromatia bacterium]